MLAPCLTSLGLKVEKLGESDPVMPFSAFHTEQRGGIEMQQRRCERPRPWHGRRRRACARTCCSCTSTSRGTHLYITHIFCVIRSLSKATETLAHIGLKPLLWLPIILNPFLTHREVNSEDETKQFQFTLSPDKEKTKKKNKTQRLIGPPRI